MPKLFRVGLTGNIASGKSSVVDVWRGLGAAVIDADILAREAIAPGMPGHQRVFDQFGTVDRSELRDIVFRDAARRAELEQIIHPEVARLRNEKEAALAAQGVRVVANDIPLLFEAALMDEFDVIVLVDAPRKVRIERMVENRGLSLEIASRMVDAQMPAEQKRERADIIIENSGSMSALEARAAEAWHRIEALAGDIVRVDMHLHTRRSFDCLNDPLALIDAATARGIDILCITDHNEIETALELKQRFPTRIIVGEEVKTGEGVDVIGLFIHTHIPKGTPARKTCDLIHEQGGIVYVPHPFARGKGGGGRILSVIEKQVDAVEGFNARLHDQALNEQAVAWGTSRGLPLGAGSDAHTLAEIGRGHVEMPRFDDNAAAFRAALATAKIHGRESSRLVHVASTYAKLHKKVFHRE